MFRINVKDNNTISMNRGDSGTIHLHATSELFIPGDKVKFIIATAGDYTDVKWENIDIIQSGASTTDYDINIAPSWTKAVCPAFGAGAMSFWYEISIENAAGTFVRTIVGADEKGPKLLLLYPEGETIV